MAYFEAVFAGSGDLSAVIFLPGVTSLRFFNVGLL